MGGKGRISNELVAASCAAVLAVYAAGYWRTRDEAKRMETRAHERRPLQPERSAATRAVSAAVEAAPAVVDAALPTTLPAETASTISPAKVSVTAPSPAAVANVPSKAVAAVPLPPVASPQAESVSTETRDTTVAVTSAIEPEPASLAPPDSAATPSGNWRDGTYTGWGTSRHGDIKAQVVIRNGRIVESSIASCETRYPCDVISTIIHQPVERQNPDVDHVSRATESADAYYFGLVDALTQALVQTPNAATTR